MVDNLSFGWPGLESLGFIMLHSWSIQYIGLVWISELFFSPRESYYLRLLNKVYSQNYLQNPWAILQDESNQVC